MNEQKENNIDYRKAHYLSKGYPEDMLDSIEEGWGYQLYVPDGWISKVVELHYKLKELYPDYKIKQIKDKFGRLRYYCRGVDEEGVELIREYEIESYNWEE